ncbi:MAG: hydantoinase/oxoprolinase family protein [Thermodesulfobacteriota bacterium]|nr:hydantoinase/oxoprolinase family protein [Thermodesulfobacteriota bacterium]
MEHLSEKKGKYIVYIDTGGTFTDTVVVKPNGEFISGKSPTTPDDLMKCFYASIDAAGINMGDKGENIIKNASAIGYGTTVGTNIMITRSGAPKVGFITTKGHEDRTLIMRHRATGLTPEEGMHMVTADKPEPIVPRNLIRGAIERVDNKGNIIVSLEKDDVRRAVKELLDQRVEGIAVGLLWSFLNNTHEKMIRDIISEISPNTSVSISSEVAPIVREYPRYISTMIDQYIGLPLRVLLERIMSKSKEIGYEYPLLVMQAHGGLSRAEIVKPATTLHSGPVGGLVGVEFLKRLYGIEEAVGTDVGGTSFDIALSPKRGSEFLLEPVVGRFEIANSMREIVTIGAGGGTIAWIDEMTNTLRLGPHSAGAMPGPVCYGAGGTEPTVTDADVVMNRIDPDFFLGGRMKLDREKALSAIQEKIAVPLGMDTYQTAEAMCKVVDGLMQSALEKTLAVKGVDSRDTMLVGYGGAGPTHCAGYTSGMDFAKIVIPPFGAVFSAFGASTADIRHRYELSPLLEFRDLPYNPITLHFELDKLDMGKYAQEINKYNSFIDELKGNSLIDLEAEGFKEEEVIKSFEFYARYVGQLWEIRTITPVERIEDPEDLKAIIRAFEAEYEKIYTRSAMIPRGGISIISLVLETVAPTSKPSILKCKIVGEDPSNALKGMRKVYFNGKFSPTNIYDMKKLQPGNIIDEPGCAVIESLDTNVFIPADRRALIDEYSNIILEYKK